MIGQLTLTNQFPLTDQLQNLKLTQGLGKIGVHRQ